MSKQHYDTYVPDEGDPQSPIWFVGEAPGTDEHNTGRPFIGYSGELLINCLARYGVQRNQVYLANLFHFKPYNNYFENVVKTDSLKQSVSKLYDDIEQYRPIVIVPLGNWPLLFLTGHRGIGKWRGSIIGYIRDESIKVIPTYHPAAVTRKRKFYPTFDLDIRRIVSDASFKEKMLPTREYIIDPRGMDLEVWKRELVNAPVLATDIETVKNSNHILCTGFAPSKDLAVVFPHGHVATDRAVAEILAARNRKVLQNGTFDFLQLTENGYQFHDESQQLMGSPFYFDTLIAGHTLQPELPRSLEYFASVYTREPYYKSSGRGEIPGDTKAWSAKINRDELYRYNGKDCCVTFEVHELQKSELEASPSAYDSFIFEMRQLRIAHHISTAGMLRDEERRLLIEKVLLKRWARKQFALNNLTGVNLNVNSSKQVKIALYNKKYLGLPSRRNRKGEVTTDEDAIVSLISYCQTERDKRKTEKSKLDWEVKLQVCRAILEIRGYRKALGTYVLTKDKKGRLKMSTDGRVRSFVKVAATETGRWSMSKYVDGTGYNMQTNPRDPLEISDSELEALGEEFKLLDQLDEHDEEQEEEEDEAA